MRFLCCLGPWKILSGSLSFFIKSDENGSWYFTRNTFFSNFLQLPYYRHVRHSSSPCEFNSCSDNYIEDWEPIHFGKTVGSNTFAPHGYGNMAQYLFLALENRAPSKWVIPLLNALLLVPWNMKELCGIIFIPTIQKRVSIFCVHKYGTIYFSRTRK